MDASEKASGKWCFFFAFPELFWLVWLISSVFLTRTSCHKITHANGYYGARPGMAVSVSVLPLTITLWTIGNSSYLYIHIQKISMLLGKRENIKLN